MKKKIVPKLWKEVKVKVDIVTSDYTKIYYTGKFQDFTARYVVNSLPVQGRENTGLFSKSRLLATDHVFINELQEFLVVCTS